MVRIVLMLDCLVFLILLVLRRELKELFCVLWFFSLKKKWVGFLFFLNYWVCEWIFVFFVLCKIREDKVFLREIILELFLEVLEWKVCLVWINCLVKVKCVIFFLWCWWKLKLIYVFLIEVFKLFY